MTQAERRLYLIRSLLNEKTEYQSLNVPRDAGEQRKLLRSLMNVRMPKVADEAFLRVQDEYLRLIFPTCYNIGHGVICGLLCGFCVWAIPECRRHARTARGIIHATRHE